MSRAPRNRTLTLSPAERDRYAARLVRIDAPAPLADVLDRTLCQDCLTAAPLLPRAFADLLILDPPYNRARTFGDAAFRRLPAAEYERQFDAWLAALLPLLTDTATVYVCSEWTTSAAVQRVLQRHLIVRNRITWEREKGRGARANWKNCAEDVWFATVSDRYTFDVAAVKLRRRVVAPYTDAGGAPKDWAPGPHGNYRLTHPSNLWTDVSVPFWSMPENTDHPTQKAEKLIAKLVLASSRPGDVVLDPFLGSGTTSVVAKKLGRRFVGIERDATFACLAEKRLQLAEHAPAIQGYVGGVFLERNARPARERVRASK
jgi:site-specific DNA-methyltransferase (adenine-specific)